jgi:sugar O-acyltransferase (sialic acid O-acetyltransferase NeuD family)
MKTLSLFGAGGFAREIAADIRQDVNMYVSDIYYHSLLPYYVNPISGFNPKWERIILAVGEPKDKVKLLAEFENIFGKNYSYIGNYVSKSALILDATKVQTQEGFIMCANSIITTDVEIGKFVTINLNCTIGHDCKIGDFTTLAPSVNLSGNVSVGKRCYIGSNACIREKITICDDVIIGMGAVVVKDITESGTYVGNPLRKIK